MNVTEGLKKKREEMELDRYEQERKAHARLARNGAVMSWLTDAYAKARKFASEAAGRGSPGADYLLGRADQLEDVKDYLNSLKPAKGE